MTVALQTASHFRGSRSIFGIELRELTSGSARNAVKQKDMTSHTCQPIEPEVITAPAYPRCSYQLLDDLHQRLNLSHGYVLKSNRLSELLGLPKSTFSNWSNHSRNRAVRVVIGLLERLTESEQHAFLRRHCRVLPSIEHGALAHEPTVVEQLRNLMRRKQGLTLINGKSEFSRTFVLSALGHSFPREDLEHQPASGIISESPGKLVPIEGVHYLRTGLATERIKFHFDRLWSKIQSSDSRLILLDGVWSRLPEKRASMLQLARTRHVLVADDFQGDLKIDAAIGPIQRILISGTPNTSLQLDFQ
jgi:hypothetical protein